MPWCNDEGTAEINDVMLLLRHDAHVNVPPMGASDPVVWNELSAFNGATTYQKFWPILSEGHNLENVNKKK